jgi:hypothetical protein
MFLMDFREVPNSFGHQERRLQACFVEYLHYLLEFPVVSEDVHRATSEPFFHDGDELGSHFAPELPGVPWTPIRRLNNHDVRLYHGSVFESEVAGVKNTRAFRIFDQYLSGAEYMIGFVKRQLFIIVSQRSIILDCFDIAFPEKVSPLQRVNEIFGGRGHNHGIALLQALMQPVHVISMRVRDHSQGPGFVVGIAGHVLA